LTVADIPLWPWNRNLHRCLDCGYLSRQWIDEAPAAVSNGQARFAGDPLPRCFRSAYDLGGEAEAAVEYPPRPAGEREEWPGEAAAGWDEASLRAELEAVDRTVRRLRRCRTFTPFQPGLSFEGHREVQLRRADRAWTLTAGLIGALIGALATLAAVIAVLLAA
jgi:hypothetical protein